MITENNNMANLPPSRSACSITIPENEECTICFESLCKKMAVVYPCGHVSCLQCLTKMESRPITCHMCRKDLTPFIPTQFLETYQRSDTPRPGITILNWPRIIRTAVHSEPTPSIPAPRSRAGATMLELQFHHTAATQSAILRPRPVIETDLLHARVTRNSIFMRHDDPPRQRRRRSRRVL